MKVLISSTGPNLDSPIDFHFGRCNYFLLVEIKGKKINLIESIQNQGSLSRGGAGIAAAQQVGNLKPDKIVTGSVGPNAMNVLNQIGIEIFQAEGTIKESLEKLEKGKLEKISTPGASHIGLGGGFGRRGRRW